MAVRKSSYRRPATPEGLRAIETDSVDWYSPELYANFNTGVLEEYLEERNRRDSFDMCPWSWNAILLGVLVGTIFAFITEYVGLKVGIAVAGGSYVVYAIGLVLKWKPTLNNNAGGAATAATSIGTGFIFIYPAVWLLHAGTAYVRDVLPDGTNVYWIPEIPPVGTVILATMLAGMLGTVYFILFRRIWLVDDPLPTPGFEVSVQLMEIANEIHKGTPFNARRLITLIFGTTAVAGGYTFLKDGEFFGPDKHAPFDLVANGLGLDSVYSAGVIHVPPEMQHYTRPELGLSSLLIGIGWFMRFRVAMLVSLGSFLTWFVIIPIAVSSHAPVYDVALHQFVDLDDAEVVLGAPASSVAFARIARYVAIGAILGGGLLALFKMYAVFAPAIRDVRNAFRGGERTDYIAGKGWYEWPLSHIVILIVLILIAIPTIFVVMGGFSVGPSIALGGLLFAATFALGAIAVKVMGETGQEPVSGTTFLFLLLYVGILFAIGTRPEEIALVALIGATVFGCAITMSGTIILDYKAGLYVGNRPYHLMRSTLTGIIPGTVAAAIAATVFSILMVSGRADFIAPQSNAFAGFTSTILGGPATAYLVQYILLGAGIGIAAEYLTGMGTAFGLGMYFPTSVVTPNLLGGILRDWYELRILEPRSKAEKWSEKRYILSVLDTFMVAAGLIIGEALVGVLITMIYLTQ
ncbi:MAG TPA: OPT/YSL family transporter [Candidatus Thermoplasmatota archaeon]|nr:OPT/YSL family transporter [Candidatus Thermoplasmatota archaeon]